MTLSEGDAVNRVADARDPQENGKRSGYFFRRIKYVSMIQPFARRA
jgi:hypothetical protein